MTPIIPTNLGAGGKSIDVGIRQTCIQTLNTPLTPEVTLDRLPDFCASVSLLTN